MTTGDVALGSVRTVKSADRTVTLLEHLSTVERPQTLRELCDALAVPRASMYALLVTLQRRGWVESDGSRYGLGIRSLRAGAAYLEADDTVGVLAPILDELNATFAETVHLARLDGSDIVYLVTKPSRHSLSVVVRPGRRVPAWLTALGKALLAVRSWDEVDALLPARLEGRTPSSITDRASLRAELDDARRRGYAVDNEESIRGIRCFAVTVDVHQPPVDAISFSVPLTRLDAERETAMCTALADVRERLRSRWSA